MSYKSLGISNSSDSFFFVFLLLIHGRRWVICPETTLHCILLIVQPRGVGVVCCSVPCISCELVPGSSMGLVTFFSKDPDNKYSRLFSSDAWNSAFIVWKQPQTIGKQMDVARFQWNCLQHQVEGWIWLGNSDDFWLRELIRFSFGAWFCFCFFFE